MHFLPDAVALDCEITQNYRWLHAHPELPFEEKETTAYIVNALKGMDIPVTTFPDYHGAIGIIEGAKPGKTVMLRADIDALPITENSGEPFAATNDLMHACGHDAHTAMLLGAAKILSRNRDKLEGTVKLLFQSAEEGFIGARYYCEKGYVDNVDAVFGMHVWGNMEAPFLNIEGGPRMASCDNFKIVVNGYGAHGSTPHLAKDALMAATSIILNLQTFASRNNDPLNPLVITVGTVRCGTQFNIIPGKAEMEGTVRTFSKEIRKNVEPGMRRIIENTAEALGCTAELIFDEIEDAVFNDPGLADIARASATALFGESALVPMPRSTGAEDFSTYLEKAPGVYCFLGCLNKAEGITHPNHSDKFRVDQGVLHRGAALYAQFARDYLATSAKGGK